MTDDDGTRRYRKRKRARQEEETRRRITEAVVELHRTVGPAATRVTEVAELAGVSRMTVYNHFPNEADLIEACSTHWSAAHPFPEPEPWGEIAEPRDRVVRGLTELYDWYVETEDMMSNVLRDAPRVEPLDAILRTSWRPYLRGVIDALAAGWVVGPEREDDLRAAITVAVDFRTWSLLDRDGRGPDEAARLAARMVSAAAQESAGVTAE